MALPIDDRGDYKLYKELASKVTDPVVQKCAAKAALYFSDASEAFAVGMKQKASQYRAQARQWARRFDHELWTRCPGMSMGKLLLGSLLRPDVER